MAEPVPSAEIPHDLAILSDLHMGRGFNEHTRRFHPLETFFYDEDFHSFCRFLAARAEQRGRPVRLILNGDTFDFLRILRNPAPDPNQAAREQHYGSELTPDSTARIVADILRGHPRFVEGLAHLLTRGHGVVLLPGNHDLELHWRAVQQAVRDSVCAALQAADAKAEAIGNLEFRPWFYFEPGRIWVEHGCQYDPENAFQFPLRGALGDEAGFTAPGEVDLPLGNFFQRYLYNAFGSITFIVPSSRAGGRYFRWLVANEPRLLLRVAKSTLPFALEVLRRLARADRAVLSRFQGAHEEMLAQLAASSGLGERLGRIDACKQNGADALLALKAMGRQTARLLATALASAMAFVVLWTTLSYAITELSVGFGLKAALSLALNSVLFLAVASLAVYRLVRLPSPSYPRPLREAARKICEAAGVPLAVFGHTHEEVVFPLHAPGEKERWYLNSGTWIAVFAHDVLLPRKEVQFTFVDVEGGDARLVRWSPGRGDTLPVVLLDDDAHTQQLRTHPPR